MKDKLLDSCYQLFVCSIPSVTLLLLLLLQGQFRDS